MLEKTFSPSLLEEKYYTAWENGGHFKSGQDEEKKPYTIMMPPPNVTGKLHIGHALTFSLQDILIRFQRKLNKDVLWQPGTDHAGIATQMVVERQLDSEGTSRHNLGREAFLKRVWQWKEESGNTICEQLRRLGAGPDWERQRFTMDEGLSKAVIKVFVQLYNEGLIFRDKRLVNWDPILLSAISDLEVEKKDTKGSFYYIIYPIAESSDEGIVIATTRPETMFGDVAIAVHPDDERYQNYIGKKAIIPICEREIPIIADTHCDPELGTGAVKITPAHDFNDFDVGKRHNLAMINIFDEHARLNHETPDDYQGLDRFEARAKLIEELKSLGLLHKMEEKMISVPFGDRSNAVIEPRLTDQWYVDAYTLAQPAIKAVETGETKFFPENWENTYFEWLRNIQPWCISRQLWWGHRIPAWYGPDGHFFVAESLEDAQKQAVTHYQSDEVSLTQDNDVLDTWFSSALWPFSTLGWPEQTHELQRYYPTDVLVTGFDIIFFWVARMMMMSLHFMKEVPFKTVYVHALVRDEHGQKMSKSKGNIIDPLELIDQFGSDALRFTLCALAAPGRDVKLSQSRVEGYRNFATKLWNAARYCSMNGCAFDETFDPTTVKHPVNQWLVYEIAHISENLKNALHQYRFHEAAHILYQGIWGVFCDWYLEFSKSLLKDGSESLQQETRKVTAWALLELVDLLHPIMPFITEELWNDFTDSKKGFLINKPFCDLSQINITKESVAGIQSVIKLISEIRTIRAEMNIPVGASIHLKVDNAPHDLQKIMTNHIAIISKMARVEDIEFVNVDEKHPIHGAIPFVFEQTTILIPLEGVIDIVQHKERLEKDLARFETELDGIAARLKDPKFTQRAPEAVVQENRKRFETLDASFHKTKDILMKLNQIS